MRARLWYNIDNHARAYNKQKINRQSRAGLPVYFLFIIRSGVIIDIVPQAGAHCNCPAGVV